MGKDGRTETFLVADFQQKGIARTCEGGQAPLQISPLLYLKPCWDLFGGTVHSFLTLWSE